jgi:alpha-galactosidase
VKAGAVAVLALLLVSASSPTDVRQPSPLSTVASTPPMGWNSWNSFGCDIDERKIRAVADALVSSGMRDAGYRYVVVDDCWYEPQRDSEGNLQASRQRFPSGMAALGDYVHARGLKFGLYMSPNAYTCAQYARAYPGATGSGGHEYRDARTFANWGVDYLKYDWCSAGGTLASADAAFSTMRDALSATGRPIVYSINPNSNFPGIPGKTHAWCGVAHLTRTTEDIQPLWDAGHDDAFPMGIRNIIDVNSGLAARSAPGCWNDPDMLEVGVRGVNGYPRLTPDEARTHLSMWAMMAAPLIAGNDPTSMTEEDRRILTAPEVLAVDQDPLGRAATPVTAQVWAKPLTTGTAVALYNPSEQPTSLATTLHDLGLSPGRYQVRDLWDGREWTTNDALAAQVPAHGTALLRVSHLKRLE